MPTSSPITKIYGRKKKKIYIFFVELGSLIILLPFIISFLLTALPNHNILYDYPTLMRSSNELIFGLGVFISLKKLFVVP